jgi:hypothetical protein
MRYAEIVPKNGSHQIVVDGKEWARHNDVKTAEQVRSQNRRGSESQSHAALKACFVASRLLACSGDGCSLT